MISAMRRETIPTSSVKMITGLAVTGTLLSIIIYYTMGGSCIWWCISREYSFFGKLLRFIPLLIFIVIQLGQVFVYKKFMEKYFQQELSIKSSFLSLIVIVPAILILYVLMDLFGVPELVRDIIYYLLFFGAIIGGTSWAMKNNVQSVGKKGGVAFTIVTFILIAGGLLSILLAFVVILQLFLQVLSVVLVVGGAYYAFRHVIGRQIAVDEAIRNGKIFYDDAGNIHPTAGQRDEANRKIREKRDDE